MKTFVRGRHHTALMPEAMLRVGGDRRRGLARVVCRTDAAGVDLHGLRVLVVGINFPPEVSGIAPYTSAFVRSLDQAGATVEVVTGVPHYPAWRVDSAYRRAWRRREVHEGVAVTRYRHWVPRRAGLVGRALMELSFFARAAPAAWRARADVVVAVSPSLAGAAAAIVARRGRPVGVIVQDLVGNAAGQSQTTGVGIAGRIARAEYGMLRRADVVGCITPGFREVLLDNGVRSDQMMDVGNFTHVRPCSLSRDEARAALGWPIDRYIVLHTGNMGMKQGLEVVVDAARSLDQHDGDIEFVLVGDGNQRAKLEASALGVPSVRIMPPVPEEMYPTVLAAADVLLLSERAGVREMSLPSKLTSYVTAGRPILAAVEASGLTHDVVRDLDCGFVVEPSDPSALLAGIAEIRRCAAEYEMRCSEAARADMFSPAAAARRYTSLAARLGQLTLAQVARRR